MAWTERLSSGKHRGCWRDPSGKKCYTRRPEFPEHPYGRKRDALEAAQEAEVQARRRAAMTKGVVSASVTFGEWWEVVVPSNELTNTHEKAESIGRNHLLPRWEETALNAITQRDAKAWVADLTARLEPSYVHQIFGQFRRAINLALDADPPVLTASPCAGVKLPTVPRKDKTYLDVEWLDELSSHRDRRGRLTFHPNYADLTRAALLTGLRPGEMCGLHADAVDVDRGWLSVRAVHVDRRHVIRGWPKNKKARRVPMVDEVVAIVRRQLAGRDLKAGCGVAHSDGKPCRSVLVFRSAEGRATNPDTWRTVMSDAAGRAGLESRSPYDCRRGFATLAARGGVDVFELAALMGHADVRQTQEYVQQSPQARERLRVALGDVPRLKVVPDAG